MKKSILLRVSIISWFAVFVTFSAPLLKAQNSVVDSVALVALYNATNGNEWTNNTNWLDTDMPINMWFGVTVGLTGHVETLNLCSNNLTGVIPSDIGDMVNLRWLRLCENQLTGFIPTSIGNLTNLERLDLYSNQLTGGFPAELGDLSNLKMLNLHDNQLSGVIPPAIEGLVSLERLDLYANQFTGNIPPEIGALTNVKTINLYDNLLTGIIPEAIMDLPHLERLDLGTNQLTGTIPMTVGNLTSLKWLYLNNNQLAGEIPTGIGSITGLQILNVENNQLEGELPAVIGVLSDLRQLEIAQNLLTGNLPPEIGNLTNLDTVDFSVNLFSGCFPLSYSAFCDISRDFSQNEGLPGGGDFDAFCYDLSGGCANVFGQIIQDDNGNCLEDTEDVGLYRWGIIASNGTDEFTAFSRPSGYYGLNLPIGNYDIVAVPPIAYWTLDCEVPSTVTIVSETDVQDIDFFAIATESCPNMAVDISTAFVRGCSDALYEIVYSNSGSAMAENVTVEVDLNEWMTVNSTSIPIAEQQDNTYLFNLGNVGISEVGRFQIEVSVSCDVVIGQTLCVDAHIYPDASCLPVSPDWAGDEVALMVKCEGDSVRFMIENVGEGNMPNPGNFFIIEDGVVLLTDPEEFLLMSGESVEYYYDANGDTYIFQATQAENYPGLSIPTVTIEGCGTHDDGSISLGFVTQFGEDDGEPFISIDCQEAVGSFDPNDKKAYPKGYGEEHFIDIGQDIEYHIRFQNTGTDTAYKIVVKDVISPYLDMTTLQTGTSSHDYYINIVGDTLQFVFNNIMLPDSNVNETASHGFVKFRISQKTELPLGTVINNTADIYFDNNEPVQTNTTTHVLGVDYLKLVDIETLYDSDLSIKTIPNPFDDYTTISLIGVDFNVGKWMVYDVYGRLLKWETFTGKAFHINGSGLSNGTYVLKITLDGMPAGSGKLIVK